MTNTPDPSVAERVALLPCPFCGSDAELKNNCFVACKWSCGADGPVSDHGDERDGERAIKLWNTRAAISSMPEPALEEENARLREALGVFDREFQEDLSDPDSMVVDDVFFTVGDFRKLRAARETPEGRPMSAVTERIRQRLDAIEDGHGFVTMSVGDAQELLAIASLTRKNGSEGVEKLAEALVAHNDALRSCCAVADRDGKDTNWTGLRGTIRMTLLPYHETVNEARALKEGASREG